MSSGFISETQLEERKKKRQEEWEKVRKPDQPLEVPEEEFDSRSLYDRLQEQKVKKQQEYEEAHKLKNMIKGLDNDEVDFLDLVDRSKMEEERKKNREEAKELQDFRQAVATLKEQEMQGRLQRLDSGKSKSGQPSSDSVPPQRTFKGVANQKQMLAGAVKRKSTSKEEPAATAPEKVARVEESTSKDAAPEPSELQGSIPKPTPSTTKSNLVCVGVLPGLLDYPQTDSECSSDSEEDDDKDIQYHKYDLCGRNIKSKDDDGDDPGQGNT